MIAWFARNPIAANLLMVIILGAGLATLGSIRQITFPDVAFDLIDVTVEYPGAAPDEVEESVCVRVEEAIHGVEGIKRIRSRAVEGRANITAELENGADARRVAERIRTRVSALRTLPEGASPPVVEELIDNSVLLSVVIAGDLGERPLRRLGERVRDDVSQLPGISLVELVSARPYEISIEVSESALRRHGLTFDDVARSVRESSLDRPAGSLKTGAGEILLRARSQARDGEALERLPILTRSDGTRLRLGDVARVIDGFADVDERAHLDGQSAVIVRVMTRNDRHVLSSSRVVRDYVAAAQRDLPAGARMVVWDDESEELLSRRSLMVNNGLAGLALVALVLAIFLGPRLALWVTLGIPVAFLGSIAVMGVLDVSLNMLTLFAFIVALGLVVDDAIVVGESIAAQREHAGDPAQAATRGTLRVALPVVVAVLTTILFVSPQLFVPGFFGKLVKGIAIVIISCLAFSLVESLLVLPAHLTHREHTGGGRWGLLHRLGRRADALQRATDARLRGFIERRYLPWLDRVLARPALALAVASVGVMLSVSLVAGGWVPVEFTPQVEGETVTAELELEKGTPPEVTWAALRRIEGEMIALGEAYRTEHGSPLIRHVVMSLGSDPGRHDDMKRGAPGGHVGRVRAQLVPSTGRDLKSFEIAERWRARVRDVVGAVSLRFNGEGLIDDPNVEIQLTGEDPVTLLAASEALRRHVASMPGVRQVADSHRPGKRELAISVRPEAEAFGLTQRELARQVQQGFHGERVQTLQRGRDEVAVVVRYPRSERSALGDLENVRIRTSSGGELPFARVAYAELSQGTAAIHRSDRRRSVRVTADVDPAAASPSEVLDSVLASLPGVLGPYPGVRGERSGMSRESGEVFANRTVNVVVALLVSYALFAVTLRSYLDPLLVMVAIPFGVGGAIAAHAVLGLVLSSFSMIGIIALIGVVVNDSLVLVYAAKERRLAGEPAGRALRAAAAERFRPILLTSLTTFFGLLPLLFESSSEAEWLKPIGVTLAFGVLLATGVTLIVVPAASVLLDRLRGALVLGPRTRSRVRSARAAVPRGAEEPVRRIVAAAPPA